MKQNRRYKLIYKLSQNLKIDVHRFLDLSLEQLNYINLNLADSTYLDACPGSGKTEVISLKFCNSISNWRSNKLGIAILTFTTGAAKVLDQRIKKYFELVTYPHFVGTFDSWLHNYILQPYCHTLINYTGLNGDKSIRIIEDDSNAPFLHAYTAKFKYKDKILTIRATEYYFSIDWKNIFSHDENTHKVLQQISKEDLIVLRDNKIKFIEKGFATYTDAEILSIKLLIKYPTLTQKLSKRFPALFIDECQDLSEHQIAIIELFQNAGSTIHCVGDVNQSIYKFRKVDPENFIQYSQKQNLRNFSLTRNFRSNQNIVDVCNALVLSEKKIEGHEKSILQTPVLLWEYDDTNFKELPIRFEETIKASGFELKNAAILARGKNTIAALKNQSERSTLTKSELIALALFTWATPRKNTETLNDSLKYMGSAISALAYGGLGDYKNQSCPKHIDPVNWRLVLKDLLDLLLTDCPFNKNNVSLLWPMWISSLKGSLDKNWNLLPMTSNTFSEIKAKIKTPDNCTAIAANEICSFSSVQNKIRTTTIHSVKGETLDAVLLISHKTKQSKGGHHSQWIEANAKDDEHVRFAFVACSRPKHLLILATSKLKPKEISDLERIGFKLSFTDK